MTYEEFINNIINTRGRFLKDKSVYKERHHILPRCLGGLDSDDNLIDLYADEHFIAHFLLAKENPNDYRLGLALNSMLTFNKCIDKFSIEDLAEEYEESRIIASKAISESVQGSKNGMYGKFPWNKGLTKDTDERVRYSAEKMSKSKLGVKTGPFTEEHKQNMRIAFSNRTYENYGSSTRGKIAITNGDITKYIYPNENIPKDFYLGSSSKGNKKDMSRYYANEEMQRKNSLSKSGSNNSSYGHGERVSGGKNGKAIYDYWFKGKYFECRKYLLEYLILEGYNISESTLRSIQNGTYGSRIENKYKTIIDNLEWRLKVEDKVD